MPAHEAECPRRRVECPHPDCGRDLAAEELEDHDESCVWRPAACDFCGEELPRCRLPEHRKECKDRVVSKEIQL